MRVGLGQSRNVPAGHFEDQSSKGVEMKQQWLFVTRRKLGIDINKISLDSNTEENRRGTTLGVGSSSKLIGYK